MDSAEVLENVSWSRHQSIFFYSVFVFWNFCGLVTALSVIAGTWLTQTIWRNHKVARIKTSQLHLEGVEPGVWDRINSAEEAATSPQSAFYMPFVDRNTKMRLKIL